MASPLDFSSLETPAGFQNNSGKVVAFFEQHLLNYECFAV